MDKRRPDGLRSMCRACDAELSRERRATAKRTAAPVVELRPGLRLVESPQETAPAAPVPPGAVAQDVGGGRHTAALERAIGAADWLGPLDAAVIEYARGLARGLDAAEVSAMSEFGVSGVSESPQYLLALKALRLDAATRIKEAAAPSMPALSVANY